MPVSSSSPNQSVIKLLSTDFDGTLVNHEAIPPVGPELFSVLKQVQARGGFWAVNTGRELAHIVEGLQEFGFTVEPDYVLTAEREVFHRGPTGEWQDFGDWNARCVVAHNELFAGAGSLLQEIEEFVAQIPGTQMIRMGGHVVGLVTRTDAEMDRICVFLERERVKVPSFHFMRNTVYVRFCHEDYSKGSALGELARLLQIEPAEIFAAGDHFNDLPMLDGQYAKAVACPANAVGAVKETVLAAGGYVAKGICGDGIVEALRHFGAVT
ncbi:MAG TPA: HAD-IIB family hydrolase [Chthoniobacteraceae bacterium]|nr:HAD-IIB family hydrolase [Chthoniobacteraceae bacterium]